ncbi:hypothetical protein Cgig2_028902 [Carnegiea gigantea]|uniref:DUF1771 domain-containing protein n=1 Tax=Carnegiea gigantea TaxID=171969 RepID=A0A9Q1KSJ4_9CARY|nr:hypothetical protein Cgig2_028902 [Carnegiea gigantea]
METLRSNTTCDNENRALKSLFDTFGSMLSLEDIASAFYKAGRDADLACELLSAMQTSPSVDTVHVSNGWVKSETSSKSFDDNGFSKSSYANGNCDEKASKLKRSSFFGGYVAKEYVWRAKTRSDADSAGVVMSGTLKSPLADTAHLSKDCIKSEISSGKSSDSNSYNNKSSYANGNDDSKPSELEKTPSHMVVGSCIQGKNYVWRVRLGQDANPEGEILRGIQTIPPADTAHVCNDGVKEESNSKNSYDDNGLKGENTSGKSTDDNAFSNSCFANGNDDSKASRLKKNSSYTVVGPWAHRKDYVWRVREGQDANPNSEVLGRMQTSPSLDLAHGSNGRIKSETSSLSSGRNGFNKLCYPNRNSNYTRSRLKTNPAPGGTLSSIPGKDHVWRPRKGQDVDLTGELLCGVQTSPSADMAYVSDGGLKGKTTSTSPHDDGFSKSCFGNGSDDCEVSRLKRNPVSAGTSMGVVGKDFVWRVRTKRTPNDTKPSTEEANKNLGSACSPLSERDANSSLNKDFEDFLLDTLGKGFQLERSAIQEVLGDCGYDMKKSLDTVLNLAAANLDRRNGLHKGSNLNSNSQTLSSENQWQRQNLSESGRRTMRSDAILSIQSNERGNQKNKVHERPDSNCSTSVSESSRRSEVAETVVTEPHKNIAEEHNAKAASCVLVDARDEAEEDGYQILRKTVKEYRDTTKEYYKAAAEAFAGGDRGQASILLEKGKFFYNKAREADEESAKKIFEISFFFVTESLSLSLSSSRDGEIQDDVCLDLRHHNAKEAIHLLKCHLCSLSGILSIKNLKIIFGMGEQNVEKPKQAVKKLLTKEAIEWIEDGDSGAISICLDQINPKRLSFTENGKAI